MRWRNTRANWGAVAKSLHWVIALAIVGNVGLGLFANGMPASPEQAQAFYWHKTTGLTILGLVALRILWRLANTVPDRPSGMPAWQRIVAGLNHFALYLVMLAMPLSGWIIHSASGAELELYGVVEVPSIIPAAIDEARAEAIGAAVHYWLFIALCALVALHVLGALKHQLAGDKVLVRMLPLQRASDPIRGE